MTKPIRSVAVLGSGVMGGAIAAHVANAGLEVLLLDVVPPDGGRRNAISEGALKRMAKHKPAPFSHPNHAMALRLGNLDDDLEEAAQKDLVIEAVIERLDIKRALFERLDQLATGDSILASNTSGLRIVDMLEGRSERFRQNFLVTHFFNPPRYMKLLELVLGPETSEAVVKRVVRFGKEVLGKGVVLAKDTPNFVANRIGAHAMMVAIREMTDSGLAPEDVDAITGIPVGRPKSATFRTADIVGLDTLAHVVKNCHEMLPDDEDRDVFVMPEFVGTMIEKKILGDKTGGGFYRKSKAVIETLSRESFEYQPRSGHAEVRDKTNALGKNADPKESERQTVASEGVLGQIACKVIPRGNA
jgi:3-hydroxyacyl-CoA dehydrogenase